MPHERGKRIAHPTDRLNTLYMSSEIKYPSGFEHACNIDDLRQMKLSLVEGWLLVKNRRLMPAIIRSKVLHSMQKSSRILTSDFQYHMRAAKLLVTS